MKKDIQQYKQREMSFLNNLDNEQLELYSIYSDNKNQNSNVAKTLLSFRRLTDKLSEEQKSALIALYDFSDRLKEQQQYLANKKDLLSAQRENLDRIAELKVKANNAAKSRELERHNLELQIYAIERASRQRSLEAVSQSLRDWSSSIRDRRAINSLEGIERAIRGY